ncbi:hypothetical protein AB0A73_21080 [Glycomyces sp. NPDC047369]
MRRHLIAAAALAALAGLAACGTAEGAEPEGTVPQTTASAVAGESSSVEQSTGAADTDPRLEVLVGTWEADPEEVGPHGSTLRIDEDGTAVLDSFANQHGAYEGAIVLGDAEPHRFEGTEPETGDDIVLELEFDAAADTLAATYPDGAVYVHTRA